MRIEFLAVGNTHWTENLILDQSIETHYL